MEDPCPALRKKALKSLLPSGIEASNNNYAQRTQRETHLKQNTIQILKLMT